jgi:hypothetical protein
MQSAPSAQAHWRQASAAAAHYRSKPSCPTLFAVFEKLSASPDLWHPATPSPFADFEQAASEGDHARALKTASALLALPPPQASSEALRFVLAARAVLIHGSASLADTLVALGRKDLEPPTSLALDQFLLRMRCRVQDAHNDSLFHSLTSPPSPHAATAARERIWHRWRYLGPSHDLLAETLTLADSLPPDLARAVRAEAVSLALRIADPAAASRLLTLDPKLQLEYSRRLPLASFLREKGAASLPSTEHQQHLSSLAALHEGITDHGRRLAQAASDPSTSLAIIGNSPCEIGLAKGSAIDAHDVVARFNFFSANPSFSADYGNKFSWHVRGGKKDPALARRSLTADLTILCQFDFLHHRRDWDYFLDLSAQGAKLATLPDGAHLPLQRELHAEPSLGLAFCSFVHSLRGKLPRSSCFGFSFIDQIGKDASSAHYFEPATPSLTHRWDHELAIFDRLTSAG